MNCNLKAVSDEVVELAKRSTWRADDIPGAEKSWPMPVKM
jgi:hypothetical protein